VVVAVLALLAVTVGGLAASSIWANEAENHWALLGPGVAGGSSYDGGLPGDASVRAQERQLFPPDAWRGLGPSGSLLATDVGVSSAWPQDGFVLVRLNPSRTNASVTREPPTPAVRTFDGGRTWEPLPNAPPEGQLVAVQREPSTRVLLSGQFSSTVTEAPSPLWRSEDDGLTWTQPTVAQGTLARGRTFFSPPASDHTALLLADADTAYQSLDLGRSWSSLNLPPGQHVGVAAYSPDYARDRTVYVTAITGGFSLNGDAHQDAAADESAGILVSRDGGTTWESASGGLEIDGQPYRHVQTLALSPSFAEDRTAFAFAWGPYRKVPAGYQYLALFRTLDGGASWQAVWQRSGKPPTQPGGYVSRSWATLAMSPAFAQDSTAAVTVNSGDGHPGGSYCQLLTTTDRGASWSSREGSGSYAGCYGLMVVAGQQQPPTTIWYASSSGGGGAWWASQDGGVTRSFFGPPSPYSGGPGGPRVTPKRAGDGSVLFSAYGGIWALSLGAADPTGSTAGRLPCETVENARFAAARDAARRAQPFVGCPTEPVRAVTIRERALGDVRAVWLDDGPEWYELSSSPEAGQYERVRRHETDKEPWTGSPDWTVLAETATYDGGLIVWRTRQDGTAASLVIGQYAWEEVNDP
jgi:photosystem II stability/assembly factor-like uncharacterized protein